MKTIVDLKELKQNCSEDKAAECRIYFNNHVYTRKTIWFLNPGWQIFHHIDAITVDYRNDYALRSSYPLLFEAMEKNQLIMEE